VTVSDHEPLIGVCKKKEFATKKQENMVMFLLDHDFRIRCHPGKLVIFPDALSKVPLDWL